MILKYDKINKNKIIQSVIMMYILFRAICFSLNRFDFAIIVILFFIVIFKILNKNDDDSPLNKV